MNEKFCVVDDFGNGINNWSSFEKSMAIYIHEKDVLGHSVKMLKKVSGCAPVELPEI